MYPLSNPPKRSAGPPFCKRPPLRRVPLSCEAQAISPEHEDWNEDPTVRILPYLSKKLSIKRTVSFFLSCGHYKEDWKKWGTSFHIFPSKRTTFLSKVIQMDLKTLKSSNPLAFLTADSATQRTLGRFCFPKPSRRHSNSLLDTSASSLRFKRASSNRLKGLGGWTQLWIDHLSQGYKNQKLPVLLLELKWLTTVSIIVIFWSKAYGLFQKFVSPKVILVELPSFPWSIKHSLNSSSTWGKKIRITN